MEKSVNLKFYDIDTAVGKVDSIDKKHCNVALAYDIGLAVPKTTFADDGEPIIEDISGYEVSFYAKWKKGEWRMPCTAFERRTIMAGDVGPERESMLTTLFSMNFGRIPIKHNLKRLGDWLYSIGYDREHIFGIRVTISGNEIYYKYIVPPTRIPSGVNAAIIMLNRDDGLKKGFAAVLTMLDESLCWHKDEYAEASTIKEAWASAYRSVNGRKDLLYRNDGGRKECWMYSELKRFM